MTYPDPTDPRRPQEPDPPADAGEGHGWTPPPPPADWSRGWRDPGSEAFANPYDAGPPHGADGGATGDPGPQSQTGPGYFPPPGGPGGTGYPPSPGASYGPPGGPGYPPPPGAGYGPPGGPGYPPPPGAGYGPPGGSGYPGGRPGYPGGGPGYPPPPGAGYGPSSGGWYGWSPARPRRSLPSAVTALLLAVAVLVGLAIGHGVWSQSRSFGSAGGSGANPFGSGNGGSGAGGSANGGGSGSSPFGSGAGGSLDPFGVGNGSLSGVSAAVAAELVDINTVLGYGNGEAAGTGIVLNASGYVLTNNHVISGATSIRATDIGNGHTYTAVVVGYDRSHDVAVIHLQGATGLKFAHLGNSSKLTQGQAVDGLGNAGGVGGTPSSAPGHITALNQSITAQDESNGTSEKLTGLIQTDCNIQPGDSGGALIDTAGDVVGVDTAASTGFSFASPANQGFAIPVNQASTISDLIRSGKGGPGIHLGRTAFLGVEVDVSPQAASTSGATIRSALPNGPAASIGIGSGDVITSLGGSAVNSAGSLTSVIGRYHPGDRVSVRWTSPDGASHTATVALANGPAA